MSATDAPLPNTMTNHLLNVLTAPLALLLAIASKDTLVSTALLPDKAGTQSTKSATLAQPPNTTTSTKLSASVAHLAHLSVFTSEVVKSQSFQLSLDSHGIASTKCALKLAVPPPTSLPLPAAPLALDIPTTASMASAISVLLSNTTTLPLVVALHAQTKPLAAATLTECSRSAVALQATLLTQ